MGYWSQYYQLRIWYDLEQEAAVLALLAKYEEKVVVVHRGNVYSSLGFSEPSNKT